MTDGPFKPLTRENLVALTNMYTQVPTNLHICAKTNLHIPLELLIQGNIGGVAREFRITVQDIAD